MSDRNRLEIVLREDSEGALFGFPLRDGQYLEAEEMVRVMEVEDGIMLTVNLADYTDTDAGQEQFLNTCDEVLYYVVTNVVEIDGEEYII